MTRRQVGFDFGRDYTHGFALVLQEPAPARLAPAQEPATDPRQVDAFANLDDAQEPAQEISARRREFIQEEARPRFCHQCGEPVTKKPGKNPGTVLVCCTWEACPFHLNGYSDVGIPDPEPEPELAPACPACGTRHALEFADRPCSGCRLLRTASRLAGDEPEPEPEPSDLLAKVCQEVAGCPPPCPHDDPWIRQPGLAPRDQPIECQACTAAVAAYLRPAPCAPGAGCGGSGVTGWGARCPCHRDLTFLDPPPVAEPGCPWECHWCGHQGARQVPSDRPGFSAFACSWCPDNGEGATVGYYRAPVAPEPEPEPSS